MSRGRGAVTVPAAGNHHRQRLSFILNSDSHHFPLRVGPLTVTGRSVAVACRRYQEVPRLRTKIVCDGEDDFNQRQAHLGGCSSAGGAGSSGFL